MLMLKDDSNDNIDNPDSKRGLLESNNNATTGIFSTRIDTLLIRLELSEKRVEYLERSKAESDKRIAESDKRIEFLEKNKADSSDVSNVGQEIGKLKKIVYGN